MNIQLLRSSIRKIIQEAWYDKEVEDMGDHAFAPQNPYLEPDQRLEANSAMEDKVWLAIQKRVMDTATGPDFDKTMCGYLSALITSGKYPQVRGPHDVNEYDLYRGAYLSSKHLSFDMDDGRMVWQHLSEMEPGEYLDTTDADGLVWSEGHFDREDIVASWTNDFDVAKRFSSLNRVSSGASGEPGDGWTDPGWIFNVVLHAEPENEEMLDISPFYKFSTTLDVENAKTQLQTKSWEKEFLSLNDIGIVGITLLRKDDSGSFKLSMDEK